MITLSFAIYVAGLAATSLLSVLNKQGPLSPGWVIGAHLLWPITFLAIMASRLWIGEHEDGDIVSAEDVGPTAGEPLIESKVTTGPDLIASRRDKLGEVETRPGSAL